MDSRARLERCFTLCAERAWRLACALVRDRHEAFDVVQQAFLAAARKPASVPADDPWPWFSTVVVFEARNMRRKRRPSGLPQELVMIDPAADPHSAAHSAESSAELHRVLDELPPAEREAILLTHLGGMTHAEAAVAMGMPVKTLSSHVSRGLERLKGRLGSRGEQMLASAAALPLLGPPGGWESALAAWKAAALAELGIATGAATVAATVAGTGVVMANKAIMVAGLVLALGIGLGGGYALSHLSMKQPGAAKEPQVLSDLPGPESDKPLQPKPADADDTINPRKPDTIRPLGTASQPDNTEATRLKADLSTATAEAETLRAEVARLKSQLQPYLEAEAAAAPTFTFGTYGQIKGVTQSNWAEMAQANRAVQDGIRDIRNAQKKGERAPDEVFIRVQQNTERMRKYEYETIGVIKSWARHNGELSHPLSVANLVAGELRQAGVPLSESQVKQIEALGLAYEADIEAAALKYTADTPRCEKLLDEYLLKGRFVDELFESLSADQRAVVVDPVYHRVASCDLYCPTLMLIHTSPVLTGKDNPEISGKLKKMLQEAYGLTAEQDTVLDPLLETWLNDVAGILTPVPQAEARMYTYAQGTVALRATVKLAQSLRDFAPLTPENRSKLLDAYEVYIPRRLQ